MKKILLLIEDDLVLLRMYQDLLQEHGYEVHTALNGEDGLEKARKERPDLILLDLRMPKMDGLTAMHKIREDEWGKTANIIILTNLDLNDERLDAVKKDHPESYLIKSDLTPENLLEKISEVLI